MGLVVLAAIMLPLPFSQHHVKWLPLAAVLVLPPAALGRLDGEDWSERTVAFACLGGWLLLWTAAGLCLVLLLASRRLRRRGIVFTESSG